MVPKKPWSDYTSQEIDEMRTAVIHATPDTPFSPEYIAAYIGKSSSTLQHMRSHTTKGIAYSKIGGRVLYLKKNVDAYLQSCMVGKTA